jgi:peptidylprolyl isomerase
MHLVQALARLAEVGEDAGRIASWMRSATDWRTRSNAARAVMSPRWLESEEIRDALVLSLGDPSEHVRIAAAGSIALLTWTSEEYLALAEARFRGPVEDWRAQAAFGPPLVAQDREDLVIDWTRRVAEIDPAGSARGIYMLGGVQGPELVELLFRLAEDPDPLPRAAAVNALFQRWARGVLEDGVSPRLYSILILRLADADNLPAVRAAQALSHPGFGPLGSEAALEEAFAERRAGRDLNVLVPILESMGGSSVPLLREIVVEEEVALRAAAARALERLTGEQVPIGAAGDQARWRSIDWARLAGEGTEPRVRIETVRGEMTVRMFIEQAPLTVQTFLDQVRAGQHDGTRFHRVVSNFVAQGGDFGMGEGSGNPGYAIRTEFTQLPFDRGVLGMASAGKDTENSQYYLTHSSQPHLEGGFTAFGWIERGADVLDQVQEGDRIIRMTIQDR